MPTNMAAWATAKMARLEVGPAAWPTPGEHEIVVRNHAVAINPVDWLIPIIGHMVFSWIKFPAILGVDVAGEVVETGPAVSRFKVGDRVLGQALGTSKARNSAARGAFQAYTLLADHMASPIPDTLSYEGAAVLPLGLSTAACGLFEKDQLALDYPSATPKPAGKTVLVWGGSTSVGANAIQLAAAAGYEVFATASPRNFDLVKALGASQAFDYKAGGVIQAIIAALKGRTLAGALAIGAGSASPCIDIVRACRGDKVVSMASGPIDFSTLPEGAGMSLPIIFRFLASGISLALKARLNGIRTGSIFGDSLADNPVGPHIYVDFLPRALAEGRYVAAPEPLVVGKGLEHIQTGFDVQRRGVSARKVVVSL